MANIILLSVFSLISIFHPIHVSVTEIEYDQERKALEMTMRIFVDDLELAIRNDLNEPTLDITLPRNGKTTDELVEAYIRKNFKLKVNGKEQEFEYLGQEIELPVIYVYIQSTNIKKLKDIEVYNSIITETYDDQTNIIHIEVDGEIRSMKLDEENKKDVLTF